ncbi:MAG: hypothetical protein ACSHX3_14275 [Litorimonas sp.]
MIDSHHLRILRRIGLVAPRDSFDRAYRVVMPMLPDDWTADRIDDHHRLFKRLGQTQCQYRHAQCRICPLRILCDWAKTTDLAERFAEHDSLE